MPTRNVYIMVLTWPPSPLDGRGTLHGDCCGGKPLGLEAMTGLLRDSGAGVMAHPGSMNN